MPHLVSDLGLGIINPDNYPVEEVALQYLGAAVILHWAEIPESVQRMLLHRAKNTTGLTPMSPDEIEHRIKSLIQRHNPESGGQ